jgi:hypothetical protein
MAAGSASGIRLSRRDAACRVSSAAQHPEPFNYHRAMAESECGVYKELKDRETRAQAAWTSHLYRNEIKPKPSDRANRKQQKEKMEAYEQAHKARLSHTKTCATCLSNPR